MFNIIIGALLPIAVILLLGFFAGARHDFSRDSATVFNSMVLRYALPLALFSAIIVIPFDKVIAQKDLALGLFFGMVALYVVVLVVLRYLFKIKAPKAALLTLAITCPSAAFVGMPVLGSLFGASLSAVAVTIVSIYMNLFQVPITLIMLDAAQAEGQKITAGFIAKKIFYAIKQPLVWAPILALVLSMFHIKFPSAALNAFDLLGKTTGGVALFASGIILFSFKIKINLEVILTVIARNLIIPFIVWGAMLLLKLPLEIVRESVLTLAIPISSMAIILAIQYKESEQSVATSFFLSTVLSLATMGMFIAIVPH